MHINVSHILAGAVGDSAWFQIEGENPDIPDLELTGPISGRLNVVRLDHGLALSGQAQLVLRLECYRCLDPYEHLVNLSYTGVFDQQPGEDEWQISPRGLIDLTPLLRQEVLVSIPMQQLCRTECPGLCSQCGQIADHQHQVQETGHRPRIKKGQ
jgi:uncharacterized protein